MNIKKTPMPFIFALLIFCGLAQAQEEKQLKGKWRFSLDEQDVGEKESWFNKSLSDSIKLPCTTDDAQKGTPNELTPKLEKPQTLRLTRNWSYLGPAWYQRDIEIPSSWAGKSVVLKLERVLWLSKVWIDGRPVGSHDSLVTPHYYTFKASELTPGKHVLTLRVDNRKQFDISNGLAHAYSNETQIMWNGVLGEISMEALEGVTPSELKIYPDIKEKKLKVALNLLNHSSADQSGKLVLTAKEKTTGKKLPSVTQEMVVPAKGESVELDYAMGENPLLWNEYAPELYEMSVSWVPAEKGKTSEMNETFGMRQWSIDGCKLLLNDHRVFLRGSLECCIFPLTGTPPLTEEGWEKVMKTAKAWGLNHLRFHSWCPPKAAFDMADKLGLYLQVELPFWNDIAKDNTATKDFLTREAQHIVREYGNHPSFSLFCMGNELTGDFDFLNNLVASLKEKDARRLYAASAFSFQENHGVAPEPHDDYIVTQWTKEGWVRGQGVFNSEPPHFEKDFSAATSKLSVPLVTHEIGQYSVFPNMKEISKYKGILNPLNFKAVENDLKEKGLLPKAEDYLLASGKLAALLYKEEIERALKTPAISGFQLLALSDFPGQGTALVGLLDAFWDNKGILPADEFREFCTDVVPLVRFKKAIYLNNESFDPVLELAQFSLTNLNGKKLTWKLTDKNQKVLKSDAITLENIQEGCNSNLAKLNIPLDSVATAQQLDFQLAIEGTPYKNSWKIWVYPHSTDMNPGNVLVTQNMEDAEKALAEGKTVLFNPDWKTLKGIEGKFLPVFWSPVHFPKQATTMGVLCSPEHPALAHFPTDMHTDWQWWDLNINSITLVMDDIAPVEPIVEMIDNWTNNRRLASTFQAKVGKGKLVYTTIDLSNKLEERPVAKQLLYSLLQYMNSPQFKPEKEIPFADLHKFKSEKQPSGKKSSEKDIY